jgi:hypothetical protein
MPGSRALNRFRGITIFGQGIARRKPRRLTHGEKAACKAAAARIGCPTKLNETTFPCSGVQRRAGRKWLPYALATVDSFHKLRGGTKNTLSPHIAASINTTNVRANEASRFTGKPVGSSGSAKAKP